MRACLRAAERGAATGPSARSHRLGRNLLDVVHQAIQLPLRGDLGLAAQREAPHVPLWWRMFANAGSTVAMRRQA
jgi:hypothetical protein